MKNSTINNSMKPISLDKWCCAAQSLDPKNELKNINVRVAILQTEYS